MEIQALKEVGLNEQEAEVYFFLLKHTYSLASEISEDTKINRSVVYNQLDKLINQGIVSYVIRNNVKYFKAADPDNLMKSLKEKENKLKEILPKLKSIIPDEKEGISVEIYQGVKGGITLLRDIIKTKKDYIAIGGDEYFEKVAGHYAKQYIKSLEENKIYERLLVIESKKVGLYGKTTEIRYLPKEFTMPTTTTVYGDKVIIAIYKKPFYAILIKSKELAESYRKFLDALWAIAKVRKHYLSTKVL